MAAVRSRPVTKSPATARRVPAAISIASRTSRQAASSGSPVLSAARTAPCPAAVTAAARRSASTSAGLLIARRRVSSPSSQTSRARPPSAPIVAAGQDAASIATVPDTPASSSMRPRASAYFAWSGRWSAKPRLS